MALGTLSKPVVALLAVIQLATAVTVIAITGIRLAGVNLTSWQSVVNQKQCLLSADGGTGVCLYVYALGAVSTVFTIAIGLLQICTCGCCSCGAVMDTIMAVLAAAWWVAGGFIVSPHAARATAARAPAREWREAVVWLIWVAAAEFGAMFAVHLLRVVHKCFGKCAGRRRGGGGGGGGGGDPEKAMLGAGRPRSAALELGKEVKARPYMTNASGLQSQLRSGNSNI